ncbi:hypothetical protein BGZ94_001357 [Podila epigama]|nr:hypothetical protein BGZ94_001357 [Podila epigama]
MNASRQHTLDQQQQYQQQLQQQLQQQQQQQQPHSGYNPTGRRQSSSSLFPQKSNGSMVSISSSSTSSSSQAHSSTMPSGRPLPRTPGQASQHNDASVPSRTSVYSNSQQLNSLGTSHLQSSSHLNQSAHGQGSSSGHTSWVQPNTSPGPASGTSSSIHNNSQNKTLAMSSTTTQASFPVPPVGSKVLQSSLGTYPSTPLAGNNMVGKKSQQQLHIQPPASFGKDTPAYDESYYAALTRPISPTVIMNYIPPPSTTPTLTASSATAGPEVTLATTTATTTTTTTTTTTAVPRAAVASSGSNTLASTRPFSATAALSSSFNGLTVRPATTVEQSTQGTQKSTLYHNARNSYTPLTQHQQKPHEYGSSNMMSASTPQGNGPLPSAKPFHGGRGGAASSSSSPPSSSMFEDATSTRFARRGPLVVGQENPSSPEHGPGGTRSRRESMTYSDLDSPLTQQQFSPTGFRSNNHSGAQSPTGMLLVAKEGWLWRRGNLLTWKRCYAIGRHRTDSHPGILTLCKDNEHLFPIKTIDMAECFEVQVRSLDAKASGRFEFKVVTRKEETWFATDTMTERTAWIDALNALMAKAVGASLMKLEAKLNTIRHRNNSLEYAHTIPIPLGSSSASVVAAASTTAARADRSALEEQLQLVQQDLASREQLLCQREKDLERKRIESMLAQLEAWRSAAKVTVNQHYAVRDQLLERVMKTARTVQELLDRAKMHLETGSDQVVAVAKSHLECLKVHTSDPGLGKMKRVLLVMDQYIASTRATSGSTCNSSPASPKASPLTLRDRRLSAGVPMHGTHPPPSSLSSSTSSSIGIGVHILQIREKYKETLDLLEGHSRSLKRILERADLANNVENMRRFIEDVGEILKGMLKMPTYSFAPCKPDQPLPGAADTFYREDLVQIQQRGHDLMQSGQGLKGLSTSVQEAVDEMLGTTVNKISCPVEMADGTEDVTNENGVTPKDTSKVQSEVAEAASSTLHPTTSPASATATAGTNATTAETVVTSSATTSDGNRLMSPIAASFSTSNFDPAAAPILSLPLPEPLSSFLLPDAGELSQKLRDTILPEIDHLSIKQEESLQSMTTLLNQVSALLAKQLTEIKESTVAQRQEFEELKDEIIDVMQLSATDPSSAQREVSALSDIRSKLAEISGQLVKVENVQNFLPANNSAFGHQGIRRYGNNGNGPSAATATGFSLLQRSASTMSSSSVKHSFPSSVSLAAGGGGGLISTLGPGVNTQSGQGGRHPKIAGMARMFEDDLGDGHGMEYGQDYQLYRQQQQQQQVVVSKLDQLMLLLEFVNTAQCRMMAYQDLEYDRKVAGGNNIDDGRMMAVQEYMEQTDRKLNLQMNLLRRLVTLQGASSSLSTSYASAAPLSELVEETNTDGVKVHELADGEGMDQDSVGDILSDGKEVESKVLLDQDKPESELTLVDVLIRLDLHLLPSVKDQSEKISELSDQLLEMKQQLNEQNRRAEQQQQPRQPSYSHSPPPSLQQPAAALTISETEISSPALWRATLRPSRSSGSAHSSFRDRERERQLSPQTPLSSVGPGTSRGILTDANFQAQSTGTSEKIADMLDKVDSKLGKVIDEQLARFEKSNKDMLARVYELLEAEDEEENTMQEQNGDQERSQSKSKQLTEHSLSRRSLLKESESGSLALPRDLTPVMEQLQSLQNQVSGQSEYQESVQHSNEATWEKHLQELKALLKDSNLTDATTSHKSTQNDVEDTCDAIAALGPWTEPLEKIKDFIRHESDRTEANLNEQRDEVLEKFNEMLSSIKESEATGQSRDKELKEGLSEIREWIVHHSKMQTDNLREIVLAATSAAAAASAVTSTTAMAVTSSNDKSKSIVSNAEPHVDGGIRDNAQTNLVDESRVEPPSHLPPQKPSEIQELREQLEMFTKVQMATFSELADNVSGVEKMIRDMSKLMGVRRGGTILRKKEAEAGRAMLAMEVKETIQEVMTKIQQPSSLKNSASSGGSFASSYSQMSPQTSTMGGHQSGASSARESMEELATPPGNKEGTGIFKYLYQPRRASSMFSTSTTATAASPSPSLTAVGAYSTLPPLATAPTTATTAANVTSRSSIAAGSRSIASSISEFEDEEGDEQEDDDGGDVPVPGGGMGSKAAATTAAAAMTGKHAQQEQFDWLQDQLERLYKRKAIAEVEVEGLARKNEKLKKEKLQLEQEVEQLRREKNALAMEKVDNSRRGIMIDANSSAHVAAPAAVGLEGDTMSFKWLEQMLTDRVAMLLRETIRLEGIKREEERVIDIEDRLPSSAALGTRSSPQTPSPQLSSSEEHRAY